MVNFSKTNSLINQIKNTRLYLEVPRWAGRLIRYKYYLVLYENLLERVAKCMINII